MSRPRVLEYVRRRKTFPHRHRGNAWKPETVGVLGKLISHLIGGQAVGRGAVKIHDDAGLAAEAHAAGWPGSQVFVVRAEGGGLA